MIWLSSFGAALAEDKPSPEGTWFFEQTVSENWLVKGIYYPNKDRNDACFARREYKDGSTIEIQKDLIDGELAIWSKSMSWNSGSEKGNTYKMRVNMYAASGRFIDGAEWTYFLQTKNAFRIGGIPEKSFLAAFFHADKMALVPDGDLPNLSIYFDNKAKQIVKTLAECVKKSATRKSGPPAVGSKGDEIPSLDVPKVKGDTL
jgi:hypothetical protein